LLDQSQSVLLIIDIQERLMPAIHEGEALLEQAGWLCRLAGMLDVPILVTEQYPKGLGCTLAALQPHLAQAQRVEKLCFSAVADNTLSGSMLEQRQQVVIAGAETHVCVLQTALELQQSGKQVFVVEEAVGSRSERNKQLALARMAQHGVQIVSGEMVAFEWLRRAGTEQFKQVSKALIR
jgi:nicotinamidase-related amidase